MKSLITIIAFALLIAFPLSSFTGEGDAQAAPPVQILPFARTDTPQTWTAIQTFGSNAQIDAAAVTSGSLQTQRIPPLDASKITTGRLAMERLPLGLDGRHIQFTSIPTGPYSVQPSDQLVYSKFGAQITLGLASADPSRLLTIKNGVASSSYATVAPQAPEKLDGFTWNNPLHLAGGEAVTIASDGTDWVILSRS